MRDFENTVSLPARRVSDYAASHEIARQVAARDMELGRWNAVMGERRTTPRRKADRRFHLEDKLIVAALVMFVLWLAVDYTKTTNHIITSPVEIGATVGASK